MQYKTQIVEAYYKECKLPECVFEHRFHPTRKWRFDIAWPKYKVALEVEGGIWTGGRHSRGAGMKGDMEKYNNAAKLGWRVLRTTPSEVCMLDTVELIRDTLAVGENIYSLIEQYRAELAVYEENKLEIWG